MKQLNRYQTMLIAFAAGAGLLLGHEESIARYSGLLIVPFLMVMLFGLFTGLDLKNVTASFRNGRFLSANLIINFVWTPLFAYGLGFLFLSNDWPVWIGFVMLMVTPCTDWYLIFTGVAKGNVPLSASVLPVNLILQVLLLPFYLWIFFGAAGNIELGPLIQGMVLVLLVPFLLAVLVKKAVRRRNLSFDKSQVLFLALAVTAMFASEGKSLTDHPQVLYRLIVPVLIYFVTTYVLAQIVSRSLQFQYEDRVSLTLTTMARNSPIALAIAVMAFPAQPFIALSLIIGPLIELPILMLATRALLGSKK